MKIVQEQNAQILKILSAESRTKLNQLFPTDVPIELPLKDQHDLEDFEKYLTDEKNFFGLASTYIFIISV